MKKLLLLALALGISGQIWAVSVFNEGNKTIEATCVECGGRTCNEHMTIQPNQEKSFSCKGNGTVDLKFPDGKQGQRTSSGRIDVWLNNGRWNYS